MRLQERDVDVAGGVSHAALRTAQADGKVTSLPPKTGAECTPEEIRARRAFALFGGRVFLSPLEIEQAGIMGRSSFYKHARAKKLTARKIGRCTGILADELLAFLEAQPRVGIAKAA